MKGDANAMYDKIIETSLLYDFYAQLLTEKQREVLRLYHEENYSLSEIAESFSISRQGVFDTLKNAEKTLSEYEKKLGLVRKFENTKGTIKRANEQIDALIRSHASDKDFTAQLTEIKEIIDTLGL